MENVCKNCQVRIVKLKFTLGEQWRHQPEGALYSDGMYEFCKLMRAEPERLKKQCPDIKIHIPHEWTLRHPSMGPVEKLCYCEGNTVDLQVEEKL